jgi:hypothetical protein
VYAGPNGEVLVACQPDATLYRILPDDQAEAVIGPDGKPFTDVRDVEFTRSGRLWVSRLEALFYRDEQPVLNCPMVGKSSNDYPICKAYRPALLLT